MRRTEKKDKLRLGNGDTIEISVKYPTENQFNAIDDITSTLAYVGLFDNIKP